MTEAQDLELLDRVLLRLAMADTTEKLQKSVTNFLCPVILKLDTQFKTVDDKISEILTHLNKRCDDDKEVKFPLELLLDQYIDAKHDSRISNVTFSYLQKSFQRCELSEQAKSVDDFVAGANKTPVRHRLMYFRLIAPAFLRRELPVAVSDARKLLGITEENKTNTFLENLFDFFQIVLCDRRADGNFVSLTLAFSDDQQRLELPPPRGYSFDELRQVTLDGKENIPSDFKLLISKFICHPVFDTIQILPLLLLTATSDNDKAASDASDRIRKIANLDYENQRFVNKMYSLLQGTVTPQGQLDKKLALIDQKLGLQGNVRFLLLKHLMLSVRGTNKFPGNIQLTFQCLFGAESSLKLKVIGLQFMQRICEKGTDKLLKAIAPTILQGIQKILDTVKPESTQETQIRGLAYLNIGKLALRQPALFRKDLYWFKLLFTSLENEPKDLRLAITESLQGVITCLRDLNEDLNADLEKSLLDYMKSSQPHVRLMTVICARTTFDLNHTPSRYICLLGASDSLEDVKTEGLRGLTKKKVHEVSQIKGIDDESENEQSYPDFPTLVRFIGQKSIERYEDPYTRYQTAVVNLSFTPNLFSVIVAFLKLCLETSAGYAVEENREETEEELTEREHKIKIYLKSSMENVAPIELAAEPVPNKDTIQALELDDTVTIYRTLLEQALLSTDAPLRDQCLGSIQDIAMLNIERFSQCYRKRLPWMKLNLFSPIESIRIAASNLVGIIIGCTDDETLFNKEIETISKGLSFAGSDIRNLDSEIGTILSLGYAIGYGLNRFKGSQSHENMNQCLKQIALFLNSHRVELCTTACLSLAFIGEKGEIPLPLGFDKETVDFPEILKKIEKKSVFLENVEVDDITQLDLLQKLIHSMKFSNHTKVVEGCVETLGKIASGADKARYHNLIILSLLSMLRDNSPELQLSIGLALSRSGGGDGQDQYMETVLSAVLENAESSVPPVRQSSCLWLLCLVKYSARSLVIQRELKPIQKAFTRFLGDPGDFLQESAGKGLSLVYEICDDKLKEELVDGLMKSLTSKSNTSESQKMSQDSELHVDFGKTPDGNRLNKYKDLCSLASEMNKPELVYKFMAVSDHNALWHSRKGAAFGLSNIANMANDRLEEYLPELVPKLYRFKNDPSARTQQAMSAIWKSLGLDSGDIVKRFAQEILEDLLNHSIDYAWRSREASCLGLSNLLSSSIDVSGRLKDLWEICFRVVDDQKESVRKAGMLFGKTLSKVTVAGIDPQTNTKYDCRNRIDGVLPLLLQRGIRSKVEEVTALSLLTIQQLVKKAPDLMTPYVAEIIPVLLEAQSEMENMAMNYMSFHVEKYGIGQEKFEEARVAASKVSPMADIIDLCLRHAVNDEVLGDLIPKLLELIKGVGLNTKVSSAAFISNLFDPRRGLKMRPYSKKISLTLLACLTDNSPSVRKSCGTSLASTLRGSSDATIERCISKLSSLVIESEISDHWCASAFTCLQIGRNSVDIFRKFQDRFIPLAFLGTKLPEKDAAALWSSVWDENSIGAQTAQKMYLSEIVKLVSPMCESSSFQSKICAAKVFSSLSKNGGDAWQKDIAITVFSSCMKMAGGRTWEGKHFIVEALTNLMISDSAAFLNSVDVEKGFAFLIKEAKRKDLEYRRFILIYLNDFLKKSENDVIQIDLLVPLIVENCSIKERTDSDDDSDDELKKKRKKPFMLALRQSSFELLQTIWSKGFVDCQPFSRQLFDLCIVSLPGSIWNIRTAILNCLQSFVDTASADDLSSFVVEILKVVLSSLEDAKYSIIRKTSITLTNSLLKHGSKDNCKIAFSMEQMLLFEKINMFAKEDPDANVRLAQSDLDKTIQTHKLLNK